MDLRRRLTLGSAKPKKYGATTMASILQNQNQNGSRTLGDDPTVDWGRLSQSAGVDFGALRAKYAGIAAQQNRTAAASSSSSSGTPATVAQGGVASNSNPNAAYDADEAAKTAAALDRLDQVRVCHMCHGTGIRKYVYNFQQRESNCDECDGEGLKKRGGGSTIDPLPPKEGGVDANSEDSGEAVAAGGAPAAATTYSMDGEHAMFTAEGEDAGIRIPIIDISDSEEEEEEEEEEDEPPPIVL